MTWAVCNLWQEEEGAYLVRHSRHFAPDFRQSTSSDPPDMLQPNFFEKAFPCLFPFGRGGLEADRIQILSFFDHVRWALQYHDRRFRRHDTFPFLCFGLLQ